MKKMIAYLLLTVVSVQFLQIVAAGADFASVDSGHYYEMLDISASYNAVLYTEEGTALGAESGSGVYFPATKKEGHTIADSVGTGISKSKLAEKMTDGVLSTSGGTDFYVDMSGAVMLGTGMREWSIDVGKHADGVAVLIFNAYQLSQAQFGIYVYYENGTVEEDPKLFLDANNVCRGDDTEIYAVNAATGAYTGKKYAHALTMDFENSSQKKVEKIKIVCSDSYVGTAVMAVSLLQGKTAPDYSACVPADITRYATGKYMASYDEEITDLNAVFLANTTSAINEKYYERYFDADGYFVHSGVRYKKSADAEKQAVYTYAAENHTAKINMDKDYYKNIAMLVSATAYGGNYPSYQNPVTENIPCTLVYKDGTKEEKTFNSGFWKEKYYYSMSDKTGNPVIFGGSVDCTVDWSDGKITARTETLPSDFSSGFIYAVEIPANPGKVLDSILVGDSDKRVFLFAVTGVKAEYSLEKINEDIEEFLAEPPYDGFYEQAEFIKRKIDEAVSSGAADTDIPRYAEFSAKAGELTNRILNKGYAEVFVSPNKARVRNGSEENPYFECDEIQRTAEILLDILPQNAELHIVFGGGTYFVPQTQKIEKQNPRKLVLRCKPGENVNFCAAKKLEKDGFVSVSDKAVLAKIPESASENVLEYTLAETPPIYTADTTPGLFADGRIQQIAKYPNDGYTSVKSSVQEYSGGFSDSEYTQVVLYDDAGNWSGAKYAYAEGYFAHDYDYRKVKVAGFDDTSKRLTTEGAHRIDLDVYPQNPRRLRIVNLLEELDSPGEWYYDRDMSKLYWYPADFEDINEIRLTVSENPMLEISKSRNVEVRGMGFSQSTGVGIKAEDTDGFSVDGCSFDGILSDAVLVVSGKNCKIKNCVFTNGARGIVINSGDFQNLGASGNVVENNILRHMGYGFKYGSNVAVRVSDTGGIIKNNTISDCPSTAVSYTGNDIGIYSNEIYNVCSETNDASAVYSGRKYLARGNEICGNYIHDILTDYGWSSQRDFGGNPLLLTYAVYLDDGLSHQSVRQNIIKNVPSAFDVNCGQFNVCRDNIVIGTRAAAFYVTSYNINNAQRAAREKSEWAELESNTQSKEIYLGKYPELMLNSEENGIYYLAQPANNDVSGNLFVSCASGASISKENRGNHGTFENNVYAGGAEFADEENGDFRIRQGADILALLPNLPAKNSEDVQSVGADFAKTGEVVVLTKNNVSQKSSADFGGAMICLRVMGENLTGKTVYCAAYDCSGRLVSVSAEKPQSTAAEFCIENDRATESIGIFVWENGIMKPFCDSIEIGN